MPSPHEIPAWLGTVSLASVTTAWHDSLQADLAGLAAQTATQHCIVGPLVRVADLFEVVYGTDLEMNRLQLDPSGINFVSCSSKNNGIAGKVRRLPDVEPLEAGLVTVAANGSVMESFVQLEPFYSGRDLFYLRPKLPLTFAQKLYYCMCLRANKYKYSYGRKANRTLRDIRIPSVEAIPSWVREPDITQRIAPWFQGLRTANDILDA